MSLRIVPLAAADFEEGIDLLNFVFSQAHGPHDFEALLPKLYRPAEELMRCNYAIRDAGVMVAMAGVFPLTWQVGDTALRVAGIGGVATHPRYRGRGLMSALLRHCVAEARGAGYHLSWLDGLRTRYRHFGYERCGTEIKFELRACDLAGAGGGAAALQFRCLREGDPLLGAVRRLHERQRVYWPRPAAEFARIGASWNGALYAALDGDELAGYLVAGRDPVQVTELAAIDGAAAARVAAGWCAQRGAARISVAVSPWRSDTARRLGTLADQTAVWCCGNWQVFDWPALLAALLRERARAGSLTAGEVVLEITGAGRWRLWVDGSAAGCSPTDAEAAIALDPVTALRALFGPLPADLGRGAPAAALQAWCPLPLHIPAADRV